MPFNAPETLSNDEVYAVSAYLLFLNNIIDPEARMDAKTLPQVKCRTKTALSVIGHSTKRYHWPRGKRTTPPDAPQCVTLTAY